MRNNSYCSMQRGGWGVGGATRREFLACLPAIIVLPGIGLSNRTASQAPSNCTPNAQARGWVYVVDDCEELTDLYRQCLETAGFKVRAFADRAEALQSLLTANPPPALLITDYEGYPITAEQLMSACRRALPDMRILMASGYPESSVTFDGVRPDRFLPKPFGLDRLLAEVRALVKVAPTPMKDFPQGL